MRKKKTVSPCNKYPLYLTIDITSQTNDEMRNGGTFLSNLAFELLISYTKIHSMNNTLCTKTAIPDQPAEVVHEVCYALRCSDFPRSTGHFVTMLHEQQIYTHDGTV